MPCTMSKWFIPPIVRPDFTWPRPVRSTISNTTPPVPRVPGQGTRIFWGIIHKMLYHFSEWYCYCFDIFFDVNIVQLPFGLVMKWTDRTSIEEAIAMQMTRAAGMPVPKVLCCGEHLNAPFNRKSSILMTRLPGISLQNSGELLRIDDEGPWLKELKTCVQAMRLWSPPDEKSTCSPIGTCIRTPRVPNHVMGPFSNDKEFYEHLFGPVSSHGFASPAEFQETLLRANKLKSRFYRIMFTHGDFKAHNILVDDDGHLSGFLDWECAGWYPEYWEFTTAMRFGRDSWWFQVASWIGGGQYLEELASDVALNMLTVDSYIAI